MTDPPSSTDPQVFLCVDESFTSTQKHEPTADSLHVDAIDTPVLPAEPESVAVTCADPIDTPLSPAERITVTRGDSIDAPFLPAESESVNVTLEPIKSLHISQDQSKASLSNGNTSIKSEKATDSLDQSATDISPPGQHVDSQVKIELISLLEPSEEESPSQGAINEVTKGPTSKHPERVRSIVTRSMAKVQSSIKKERDIKQQPGVPDTGQVRPPFSFLKPPQPVPIITTAGPKRKQVPVVNLEEEPVDGKKASPKVEGGKSEAPDAFSELIIIEDDTDDEDQYSKSQVETAKASTCPSGLATSLVKYTYLKSSHFPRWVGAKTLFDCRSDGGRLWKFFVFYGAGRPFPAHLMKMLQEWHNFHPDVQAPCSNTSFRGNYSRASSTELTRQVFSESGEELCLCIYRVGMDIRFLHREYFAAVIFSEKDQPRLVRSSKALQVQTCDTFEMKGAPRVTRLDYFVTWLGVKKGWESEVCAVETKSKERLEFDPELFKAAHAHKGCHILTTLEHNASP
ncbi:uncharacterized protein N7496_004932 [Penicillium cataractarum]|uniref:Uncharacterized protein n=1 Tax=Penicillium cataractarum TaxID=2100454 RepID=A0A9W9SF87_9EURO|nr:uncharacterized protein N7496_004932 [Penicillium cataractarum]KAJ5377523.1 hypothetical protein N7496_004932 [Penicillium cataractarum]